MRATINFNIATSFFLSRYSVRGLRDSRGSRGGRERCITAANDESTSDSRHKNNRRPLQKHAAGEELLGYAVAGPNKEARQGIHSGRKLSGKGIRTCMSLTLTDRKQKGRDIHF